MIHNELRNCGLSCNIYKGTQMRGQHKQISKVSDDVHFKNNNIRVDSTCDRFVVNPQGGKYVSPFIYAERAYRNRTNMEIPQVGSTVVGHMYR